MLRSALCALTLLLGSGPALPQERVGDVLDGRTLMANGQRVQPLGEVLSFPGRPLDLVLSKDGKRLYAKTDQGLLVVDAVNWTILQTLSYPARDKASLRGLVLDSDCLWVSLGTGVLAEARLKEGRLSWGRRIAFDPAGGSAYPCGLAISGSRALVALSRRNSVAEVDLEAAKVLREIPVGVAPYDVLWEGRWATVSNWGGRRAKPGERTMASSGTDTLVDDAAHPVSGTVGRIDLEVGRMVSEVEVGLHPTQLLRDGGRIFVANAGSDDVAVLRLEPLEVTARIPVRPDDKLPFGSLPNALALAGDRLLVANGGNNAIGVIRNGVSLGFLPTGWFPTALAVHGTSVFVANAKGDGSRAAAPGTQVWDVAFQRGSLQRVSLPDPEALKAATRTVSELGRLPQVRQALAQGSKGAKPLPVPQRAGEPSVFKHVVYVLKENRTYDQVFGDLRQGNGEPSLCVFPRFVTPNHHALAEAFVLLDNYYCNGIVSADGHQWATQGITSAYQEKGHGEWTRGYDFGTDPLAFAPTPFLWDQALLHGLSFRNYGEFDFPTLEPASATWADVHAKRPGVRIVPNLPLAPLRPYTAPAFPGWEMRIPDQVRLEAFLQEFREAERTGDWPSLVLVYLPQDHTRGTTPGAPTPRAHLADNDLALGRLVEAISGSRFWQDTCIFVNEDDPQAGFDHVDGHRSLCLVVSPYTKRGEVVSAFYNQGSVLHTMARMLGLPPLNVMDALAPTMEACFTSKPDLRPYTALPSNIPLDEMNPPKATATVAMDFSRPDRIDDDALNRILWEAARPGVPYPAQLVGAHGKGLGRLGLRVE
jgi:DNA-binding beta-propeller fold protein YncE